MQILSSHDLRAFIESHGLPGPIILCDQPTLTVEAAARAMSVQPSQIVKTLLFLISGNPVLVIACGTGAIDLRPLADRFGVGKKQVKLAGPDQVLAFTGYSAGAVPPFGHLHPLPTLLSPQVLAQPFIYAGGGEENALLRLNPQDLLSITQAEILEGL